MVENPIVAKDAKEINPYVHKFRDENPKLFKGGAIFIIKGFKSEGDRIDVGNRSRSKRSKNTGATVQSTIPSTENHT